jgi:hypothetical protein
MHDSPGGTAPAVLGGASSAGTFALRRSARVAPRRGFRAALHRGSRVAIAFALGAALFVGSGLSPEHAHACSCMQQSQRDAFEQAVAVFEGHVVELQPPPEADGTGQVTVRMKIVRAWKGIESEEALVTTPANSAACGYTFAVGTSYLVYASAVEGKLDVSLCSRTQQLAEAKEDLGALGLGATPVQPQTTPPDTAADQRTPEEDRSTPTEPPARGGCASCAITGSGSSTPGAPVLLALCALLLVTCRRRSGSRP